MHKQYPHLSKRGSIYQIRRRIPASLIPAYPKNKKEITFSLQTSDVKLALKRLAVATVKIDEEFAVKEQLLNDRAAQPVPGIFRLKTVRELSESQIQQLAQAWTRTILRTDQEIRSEGLTDDDFDALGKKIAEQRAELGRMLAQGRIEPILPVLETFCHFNGMDVQLTAENLRRVGFAFLRAVVNCLDHQASQQGGSLVDIEQVAPDNTSPLIPGPEGYVGPSWEYVFKVWQNDVDDRPKSTTIASQTPWGQFEKYAAKFDIYGPADVTPILVSSFVDHMRYELKLTVKTLNGRLGKLKEIYKIAKGRKKLKNDPTLEAIGYKESARKKALRRRLPFTNADLQVIFGSAVFTEHTRSRGQSGEACYWIPLIMHYTGARPEEIAGLTVSDMLKHETLGWFFHITDIASEEDSGLFNDAPMKLKSAEKRMLKNVVSRRKIPVADELIALGILRYIEFVKSQGSNMLFPGLSKDFHDKYSGAFGKWFGRYKTQLGFKGPLKSLYSLRHNMKDLMETAKIESKYLKRILGHASGDGSITDGYGSDVPFEVIHEEFIKIKFPRIPAKPWQLGILGHKKCKIK